MLEALCRVVKNVASAEWEAKCARGLIVNLDRQAVAATRIVRAGERFRHIFPNVTEPDVNGAVDSSMRTRR